MTGAGAFLQSVVHGYGGVRWEHPAVLTLRKPRPLPGSTYLKLRDVSFMGAKVDVVATAAGWTVALALSSPASAPALEVATTADGTGPAAPLTRSGVAMAAGELGSVRPKRAD